MPWVACSWLIRALCGQRLQSLSKQDQFPRAANSVKSHPHDAPPIPEVKLNHYVQRVTFSAGTKLAVAGCRVFELCRLWVVKFARPTPNAGWVAIHSPQPLTKDSNVIVVGGQTYPPGIGASTGK